MAIQQIDQEETEFHLSPQLRGNFNYIRYTRCTFHKDFLMDATVENEVTFIDCTFVGLARFFVNGGEYKNDFTLSFTNVHRVQITGGKFNNFHLGYWGNESNIDEIVIDKMDKIEGKLQFSNIKAKYLMLRGQNEKIQLLFENCKISLVSIYRFINKSSVRFQNIEPFSIPNEPTEFNIQESNLGAAEFFYVDFDAYSEVNFRSSFLSNCIFIGCKIENQIHSKVGSKVSKGKIGVVQLEIENAEQSLKSFTDEKFLEIFNFKKEEQNIKLSEYKEQLKTLENADTLQQIEYRRENYKQLKYSFYKTGDRISEKLFHGREMEEFMKKDIPFSDKLIIKFSKCSSNFGQSVSKPIWFNGAIHILLCLILFCGLHYQGYFFTLKTPSWSAFWSVINEGLFLFLPLKAFNKHILLFDVIMKVNSGFFIYNILRASRKFYH